VAIGGKDATFFEKTRERSSYARRRNDEQKKKKRKDAFHRAYAGRMKRKNRNDKGKEGRISALTVLQARMPRRAEQNHRV
jgi:hypothetical protein